jgi:hypothetical protein
VNSVHGVGEEEHLADVFRELAELRLGFLQLALRSSALWFAASFACV